MDFRTVWFIICECALILALVGLYQAARHERLRNKKLSAELESREQQFIEMLNDRDSWKNLTHSWEKEYGRRGEFLQVQHKCVADLKKQMRTAWHAHQVVKKGKQVICLTAIVQASDGPGAVDAFEAQMKEVKAKMRIRSKAPVFAKPVFPNI